MSGLPKLIYRFKAIPIKISVDLKTKTKKKTDIDRLILKFIQKYNWPEIAKAILKENKASGFLTKTYYKVMVIKIM